MRDGQYLLPVLICVFCSSVSIAGEEFTLGLLIPFHTSDSFNSKGLYYAPAISQAVEDINNMPDLLPGHNISFIWNDTECDEEQALRALFYQIQEKDVSAIIGPGCACATAARLAAALDIPMISFVSFKPFSCLPINLECSRLCLSLQAQQSSGNLFF